jgi:predicted RNase H-like HicB family nuclease
MSVSIILRQGESIQDAMARAKTTILKQKAANQSDEALNLSMDELNAMFNPNNSQA